MPKTSTTVAVGACVFCVVAGVAVYLLLRKDCEDEVPTRGTPPTGPGDLSGHGSPDSPVPQSSSSSEEGGAGPDRQIDPLGAMSAGAGANVIEALSEALSQDDSTTAPSDGSIVLDEEVKSDYALESTADQTNGHVGLANGSGSPNGNGNGLNDSNSGYIEDAGGDSEWETDDEGDEDGPIDPTESGWNGRSADDRDAIKADLLTLVKKASLDLTIIDIDGIVMHPHDKELQKFKRLRLEGVYYDRRLTVLTVRLTNHIRHYF